MTTIIEHAFAEPAQVLEISRRFNAPPERVFDAWLGEDWGQWLGPRGARCEKVSVEPRVGGSYKVRMITPDGRTVEIFGVYREVQRPEKLAFTWASEFCSSGSLITLAFERDGAGTLMRMRQEGFDSAESRNGHNEGWNGEGASFDRLDAFLAKSAG
jgi:uncharacterized protein YndB with AHSA1/START domain